MSAACDSIIGDVGTSIAASLRGVDCLAAETTASAFGRMFGSGGALVPALTILLTLYVAFFAISLLTGRARLGVSALTPRMITMGLVLTFATSWVAYQGVVWNLATGAPDQIAGILLGSEGKASQIFADKIDIVFDAVTQAAGGEQQQAPESMFSPRGLLWTGATLLLLGTVGVLVASRIALAVLVAIGPVFVVMALFSGTRGLFAGWLRGVVMLAVAPLFAVLGGTMMLELAVPVIAAVATVQGDVDPRAAMAFFLIGAVHIALMVLVLRTAGAMVAGWSVFGLAGERASERGRGAAGAAGGTRGAAGAAGAAAAPAAGAGSAARRTAVSVAAPLAANDSGPAGPGGRREVHVYATGGGAPASGGPSPLSRTRGIGSRFRAAPPRKSELVK